MRKDKLARLMERCGRRYAGRYVAVVSGRVVAFGRSQLAVFRKAERHVPKEKEISLFYIPSKSANPLLLKLR